VYRKAYGEEEEDEATVPCNRYVPTCWAERADS
jgi:hypothetical protein